MVTKYFSGRSDLILTAAISLGVGFGLGYLVRDGKYEKITLDDDGVQPTDDQAPIVIPTKVIVRPDDEKPQKQTEFLVSKIKAQAKIDAEKREQDAIRDILIEEGTNYHEYAPVRDDHDYPVYPTGRPNPDDIQVASGWDQEAENALRVDKDVYIISRVEFYENDGDGEFGQESLAYYSDDDILTSEDDQPVHNYQKLIGELRFGHGSEDENVFYVRNTELQMEYEVCRIEGSFLELVLGMELEE